MRNHNQGVLRKRIWCKTDKCCAYCGKPLALKDITIDHIVPLLRSSSSHCEKKVLEHENNKVACCFECNTLKGNSNIEEFRRNALYKFVVGLSEHNPLDENFKFYFETLILEERNYSVLIMKDSEKQTIQVRAKNCKEVIQHCNKHFRTWDVITIQLK